MLMAEWKATILLDMHTIYGHCLRMTQKKPHSTIWLHTHIRKEFRILIDRKVQIKIHDATGIFHYLWPFWLRILCHQFPVSNAKVKRSIFLRRALLLFRSSSSSSVDKFYFLFFYLVCFYSLDKGHERSLRTHTEFSFEQTATNQQTGTKKQKKN